MELTWQGTLVKVVAAITCVGIIVIAAVVAVTTASQLGYQSGDAGNVPVVNYAAVWLVRIAVAAVLVLFALLLMERMEKETFSARGPTCGWIQMCCAPGEAHSRSAAAKPAALWFCVVLALVLCVPLSHLAFAMIVLAVILAIILARRPEPMLKLRGVAVFDALLCLFTSLLMMRVGPTGDYGMARALIAIYAGLGGALLPGLAWLISLVFAPRLAWISWALYVLAGLHAGSIVMEAVGNLVQEALDGVGDVFTLDHCFTVLQSPIEAFLHVLATIPARHQYSGGVSMPCTQNTAPLNVAGTCDRIGFEVVALCFAAGLWAAIVVAFQVCWMVPKRVGPAIAEDVAARSILSRKFSSAGIGVIPRCQARGLCAVVLVILGVIFAGLGYLVLWRCPSGSAPAVVASTSLDQVRVARNQTSTTQAGFIVALTFTRTSSSTGTRTATSTATTTTNETVEHPCGDQDLPLAAVQVPPRAGCRCSEPGSRGILAWTAVPNEQLASTWCDLGQWASVCVGFFLFCCHAINASLVFAKARSYSDTQRQRNHARRVAEVRQKLRLNKGSFDATAKKDEVGLVLWKEAPKDPLPQPVAEIGDTRIFNV